MADKKIVISGQLNIDASKATKALAEIQKQFKGLEKTNFTKMMTEDFKKLQPIIKSLDKDLNLVMKNMSKTEVKDRIKDLNKGLQDQAKELKNIIKEQERYNNLMKQHPEGSSLHGFAKEQREYESMKGRAVMGKMEEASNEKKELSKTDPETIKKIVMATTAVALASNIAGNVVNFTMGKEMRKMGLQADSMSVNNRLSSMMYDKNSTSFGALAMRGGLQKMNDTSDDAQTGEYVKKGGESLGKILGGIASGIGLGALAGSVVPGIGTTIGGIVGGLGAAAGVAGGLAEYIPGFGNREEQITADRSYKQNEYMNRKLQQESFNIELGDMLLSQAEMKRDTMASMAGSGRNGGAGLSRGMYKNFGIGASVAGLSMEESASAMSTLGRSAIGGERMGGDAMRQMMIAKQSGTANVSEFAGLTQGMQSISGNNKTNAATTYKMLEQAVKSGFDKSQAVNLAKASEEIAATQKTEISDQKAVMSELLGVLSHKPADQVGAGDIKSAQNVIDISRSTNTTRGLATSIQSTSKLIEDMGGKAQNISQIIELSKIGSTKELFQSQFGKELGMDVFGEEGMSKLIQADDSGKDLFARKRASDLFREQNLGENVEYFSSQKNYDHFKDLKDKNDKGNLTGSEESEWKELFPKFKNAILTMKAEGDLSVKDYENLFSKQMGNRAPGETELGMSDSLAGTDYAKRKAGVELAKQGKAADPEFKQWMKENGEATATAIKEGLKTTLGENGSLGPLVKSLDNLVMTLNRIHGIDGKPVMNNALIPEMSLPTPNQSYMPKQTRVKR